MRPRPAAHRSLQKSCGSPWKHSPGRGLRKSTKGAGAGAEAEEAGGGGGSSGAAGKAVAPFQHANTWKGCPWSNRARASGSKGKSASALSQEPSVGMSKKRSPERAPEFQGCQFFFFFKFIFFLGDEEHYLRLIQTS